MSEDRNLFDGAVVGPRRSRRSFLKDTALVGGAASTVLASGSNVLASSGPGTTLPYQNDANWLKNHVQQIITNETQHLSALINELGAFARPKPTFRNLAPSNLQNFIARGAAFCFTGAGAYLGAAPAIANPYLANQAGSIGQVELAQSSYLATVLDQTFLPGGSPYMTPLALADVLTRIQPYVADLNGGPEPFFDPSAKSVENDIAIFNVALILEYLEVEFYTTYFPVFFP